MYYKQNTRCHLCELPIPDTIASQGHPLFGTIDHVIPRSRGGGDAASNRAPAHRCCNVRRGTREITVELKEEVRKLALLAFSRCPGALPGKRWKAARAQMRVVKIFAGDFGPGHSNEEGRDGKEDR